MKIVIRHGILSNASNMSTLETHLRHAFRGVEIDNRDYTWTDSILVNGTRLAKELVDAAAKNPDHAELVLVGHSMGGLVLRVASCALQAPDFFQHVRNHALALSAWDRAEIEEKTKGLYNRVTVCAVVTLATPNSGAMTYAQMHIIGLLLGAVLPFGLTSAGVQDLRTDHIFRVLQHCKVDNMPDDFRLTLGGHPKPAINRHLKSGN